MPRIWCRRHSLRCTRDEIGLLPSKARDCEGRLHVTELTNLHGEEIRRGPPCNRIGADVDLGR
jgi:hypothetical protein